MKKLLPFCTAGLLMLSSCAAVFNSRNMYVQVNSAHPCYLVNNPNYVEIDAGNGYSIYNAGELVPVKPNSPVYLVVARSRYPLRLEFTKDSLRTAITLRPKLSWVYWMNFAAMYPIPGFGFLADIGTEKKFQYPNDVFVDILHPRYNAVQQSPLHRPHVYQGENYEPGKVTFDKIYSSPQQPSETKEYVPGKVTFDKTYSSPPPPQEMEEYVPGKVTFTKDSLKQARRRKKK